MNEGQSLSKINETETEAKKKHYACEEQKCIINERCYQRELE